MPFSRRGWLVWLLLFWPWVVWGDVTYTVKRHETLTSISRQFGMSTARLAEHNGLSARTRLRAGQRLRIPTNKTSALGNRLLPAELGEIPASSRWRHIIIHHSGVDVGDAASMDRYHREQRHMENGLAYHFVIGNGNRMRDGEIAVGGRWRKQLDGGHLASEGQNRVSIGICLVGNFDKTRPTPRQMESLRVLVRYLLDRLRLESEAVRTHQQINVIHTRCPGRRFPWSSFYRSLNGTSS